MPYAARVARSSAAPAPRRADAPTRPEQARPELRVVEGGRAEGRFVVQRLGRALGWVRARSVPMVHVAVAITFLVGTLIGALMLRTQMVSNAFEMSAIESNIGRLTQDVQEEQARLDKLQASLPQKATDLGMVPQSTSVTIDLNGYQPPKADGAK
ncbi:hypothetical protein [Bifidobacterium pullorum]|uniref:hypothetical protein n=1 Tax=Bifidobacterium pullorum TaxID=78448 RepID=UPI001EF4E4D5|nr:hypothetical protein [Bifidobacterium pullorum]